MDNNRHKSDDTRLRQVQNYFGGTFTACAKVFDKEVRKAKRKKMEE